MMNKYKLGIQGEKHIHDLLKGSEWVNIERESREPYDVLWRGLKINVKATERVIVPNGVSFSNNYPHHEDIILVCVAFLEKKYYWIQMPRPVFNHYKKLDTALTRKELISELAKLAEMSSIDLP